MPQWRNSGLSPLPISPEYTLAPAAGINKLSVKLASLSCQTRLNGFSRNMEIPLKKIRLTNANR